MTARIFLATRLQPLYLEEVQLHRRLPPEEGYQHAHLALLRVDVVHGADEVGEGAVHDADALSGLEADLDAGLLRAHLAEDGAHLRLLERGGHGAGTDEAGHPRRVANDGPRLAGAALILVGRGWVVLAHLNHLDQYVAGEDLAGNGAAKPVADLELVHAGGDDGEVGVVGG